uniref:Uncharacterized protein n=1 Tax=Tetranychus urticae TaxID=32264 RepID=T1KY95_TETUR
MLNAPAAERNKNCLRSRFWIWTARYLVCSKLSKYYMAAD